jgi:hypothetical protein
LLHSVASLVANRVASPEANPVAARSLGWDAHSKPPEEKMKIRYSLLTLVGLVISFALPTFAQEQKPARSTSTAPSTQTKKEINFSGTHYWSGTSKVFAVDANRIVLQMDIFGVRVNDSNDGPFNGAPSYIAVLHYENRGGPNNNTHQDPVASRTMRSGQIKMAIKSSGSLPTTQQAPPLLRRN